MNPTKEEILEFKEYQKKKPSIDKNVDDHISIRDNIDCWAKHFYNDQDHDKAKFFLLNDKKNILTVQTHYVFDKMKYLNFFKQKRSLEIESNYMILARDGLVFKNLKIFRCKNELSRTYVQFEYGYYENGNPRKYCIDIQAQKDN